MSQISNLAAIMLNVDCVEPFYQQFFSNEHHTSVKI